MNKRFANFAAAKLHSGKYVGDDCAFICVSFAES